MNILTRQQLWSRASYFLLLCMLIACSTPSIVIVKTPASTANSVSALPGAGICLKQGKNAQQANIRVSHDSYQAHSETMLVEDPTNPLHLVGGSKFFTDPTHYRFQIGYFASFDGGCTWLDGGVFPGFDTKMLTSDPSFAFAPDGKHVYAAYLFAASAEQPGENGIAVSTSVDGGKTFEAPVVVFATKASDVFNDKPWLTVDQTRGARRGTLYVTWSYDHHGGCGAGNACSQELAFSRSTDNGKTFSPLHLVEGSAPFCTNPAKGRAAHSTLCDAVLGTIPVVEPDGTLAIASAYEDLMSDRIPTRLMLTTSSDGGNSWTIPVLIATIHDVEGFFRPERYRNISLPAFACDPRNGQLYVAWSDKGRDADILFAASKDGGKTWSAPLRVNDDAMQDGANQFQPQLVVAPDGVVSVSFFDTRLDPRHRLIDVYLAQSMDRGASFLKNVRVTTESWNPALGAPIDEYGAQFIGDYQGLAADNMFVHPFWNDPRTGKQEIFTAAISSAQVK
jgi:hypothetical protein